nr:helix-turn-helix domain-containing protein [Cytophagales bacterium]
MTMVFLLYNYEGGSSRFLLWEELLSIFVIVLLVSQMTGYLWRSYRTIKQYQMNTHVHLSSAEGIDVSWLKNLIYGLIFLIMIWLLQVPFPGLTSITNIGYFFVVFYISYSVIIQKDIFPFTEQEAQEVFAVIDDKKAGSLSSIGSEYVASEKRRLTELMERERPYLDNELSLPKLARIFQTSSHQLSFLINSGFRENFYDYVNRHRVNESMRLLVDKKLFHLSMVGIALESGFNSKTAFNTAFKKFTGTTPTEFRKMQLRKGTCDV